MGRNDLGIGAKRPGIKFGAKRLGAKRPGANWSRGEMTCYPTLTTTNQMAKAGSSFAVSVRVFSLVTLAFFPLTHFFFIWSIWCPVVTNPPPTLPHDLRSRAFLGWSLNSRKHITRVEFIEMHHANTLETIEPNRNTY